ncbi:MAG: CBS domain-containing protein [Candidatus Binatia bacterium]
MVVRDRMTPDPVIIGPEAMLTTAQEYMHVGHFRRLPVIRDGELIGIITDRDVRRHNGMEDRTKVGAAMTENPLTVGPLTTVEEATQLMIFRQIGGLPVVDNGRLVGILTASDVLNAFLDMTGASTPNSLRLNLLPKAGSSLAEAVRIIEEAGGEVLGVGVHRDSSRHQKGFFIRLRGLNQATAMSALHQHGYTIL